MFKQNSTTMAHDTSCIGSSLHGSFFVGGVHSGEKKWKCILEQYWQEWWWLNNIKWTKLEKG